MHHVQDKKRHFKLVFPSARHKTTVSACKLWSDVASSRCWFSLVGGSVLWDPPTWVKGGGKRQVSGSSASEPGSVQAMSNNSGTRSLDLLCRCKHLRVAVAVFTFTLRMKVQLQNVGATILPKTSESSRRWTFSISASYPNFLCPLQHSRVSRSPPP